jgi:predicted tellurium resistance membrane protein TerC
MLLEALVGGLIIGFGVSFFLLRFSDKIPTKNPVLKSVTLSLLALIIVTILLEVPSHFFIPNSDPMRYFIIGLLFNVLRILVLGIGYLYKRLYGLEIAKK